MPPLAALKVLLSLAVTSRWPDLNGKLHKQPIKCIALIDIKRVHFWAEATRELYVELLEEAGYDTIEYAARLLKSLYGFQDASRNWELEILPVLETWLGFKQGKSNPCLYWHQDRDILCEVHGDDFIVLGVIDQLRWFIDSLKKHWLLE